MASTLLKTRQRHFANLILGNHLSIVQAARAFGIPEDTARKWLKTPYLSKYFAQRQEILQSAATITQHEVIAMLVSHSRADIAEILPDIPIVKKARKAGVSHLIKEIEVRTITKRQADGSPPVVEEVVKLKLHDAQKSLGMLADMLGLKTRSDELETARTAIRVLIDVYGLTPQEAIHKLSAHMPAVHKVASEFVGADTGPIIEMESIQLEKI